MRELKLSGGIAHDDPIVADVDLGHGVVVELTADWQGENWEVWGVRLDGHLYREPRDLVGERLQDGAFRSWLEHETECWLRARPGVSAHGDI
jgi:hypothetical protein